MTALKNIFRNTEGKSSGLELFETLCGNNNVIIERIVSSGEFTPEGSWLEQQKNEWVVLLQGGAALEFETGEKFMLQPGDHVQIHSGVRHRVNSTTSEPQCIWLAVHWDNE